MPKAKSAKVKTGHQTKAEKAARIEAEETLLGTASVNMTPPEYFNDRQRQIFSDVLKVLLPAKILNDGDIYMVTNLAVSVERKEEMDKMINQDPSLMTLTSFMASRERYEKSYLRCCAELCLSPAARAKMSLAAVASEKEKDDPLALVMGGAAK